MSTSRFYQCDGPSEGSIAHFELALAKKKATLIDISKDAAVPSDGTLDPTYAPTSSTYQDSTRYVGFDATVSSMSGDLSSISLMISKDIQTGADSGKVWVRFASGSGGNTVSYRCEKKTKLLAVDTSKRARIACELSQMICTDDNPPGETCLSDFFVNQSADDAADLRLSWMDHYGVHVQERKEQVGASNRLTRSKTEIEAKWGTRSIALKYRAGITYVGTFKLDSQRSAKVQCNDLAMVD